MSAAVYGKRLRREMAFQGLLGKDVMAAAGISQQHFSSIRCGRVLPKLDTSQRIAEALACPSLHEYVISVRTRNCGICGAPFVCNANNLNWQTYCSRPCAKIAWQQQTKASRSRVRERHTALLRNRLEVYQMAVADHCRSCEPMGLCRTPECDLRAVSPLPLSKDALALVGTMFGGPLHGKVIRMTAPLPEYRPDKYSHGIYERDGSTFNYRWKAAEVVA